MSAKKPQSTRIESDSMGEIGVPVGRNWGAETQRALTHFNIGDYLIPKEIIKALAMIKKAAAITDSDLGGCQKTRPCSLSRYKGVFPIHIQGTPSRQEDHPISHSLFLHHKWFRRHHICKLPQDLPKNLNLQVHSIPWVACNTDI